MWTSRIAVPNRVFLAAGDAVAMIRLSKEGNRIIAQIDATDNFRLINLTEKKFRKMLDKQKNGV